MEPEKVSIVPFSRTLLTAAVLMLSIIREENYEVKRESV